jgi:hypothetical protein
MVRTARKTPRELSPEPWPDARSDDPIGEIARQFAVNLRDAIGQQSIRGAAARSGLNHSTLLAILEGRTWPDLETIAKLETGLDAAVWPRRGSAT